MIATQAKNTAAHASMIPYVKRHLSGDTRMPEAAVKASVNHNHGSGNTGLQRSISSQSVSDIK